MVVHRVAEPDPIEVVRSAWEAYAAGDLEEALRFLSPEIVWYTAADYPGATIYRGHEGIRAWVEWIVSTFSTYRMEVTGYRDLGDCVLAHGLLYAEVDGETVIDRVTVWRCRVQDGLIVQVHADAVKPDSVGAWVHSS